MVARAHLDRSDARKHPAKQQCVGGADDRGRGRAADQAVEGRGKAVIRSRKGSDKVKERQ